MDIYSTLKKIGVKYQQYDHPAVYTVEEANQYDRDIDAGKSKNLFLRNKKGNRHYLVLITNTKNLNLKTLAQTLGEKRLSFASEERLMKYLQLTPGSVSPFGLINDKDNIVQVIIDTDLIRCKKIAFHPNINTATIVIETDDFKKFLDWTENKVSYEKL